MFVLMLYAYVQRMMGGGDLKILTVSFLWVGPSCALIFAFLMMIFAAIHTVLAHYKLVHYQEFEGRKRIPLGPTVAAALIVTILSACLNQSWLPSLLHFKI